MSPPRRRRPGTRRPAPRRASRRRGYGFDDLLADLATILALAVLLVLVVVEALWRFVAGQVVLRRPGKYDSLWGSWAPPLPQRMQGRRDVAAPRTSWGRRPGWHRQLVRAVAAALAVGIWRAPLLTALTVAGLAATAALAVGLAHLVRHRAAPADHSEGPDDEQDDDAGGNGGATGQPAAPVLEHNQRPARRARRGTARRAAASTTASTTRSPRPRQRRQDRSARDGEVLSEVRSGLVVDVPGQRGPCRPVLDLDALVTSMNAISMNAASMNAASMNAASMNAARGGLS